MVDTNIIIMTNLSQELAPPSNRSQRSVLNSGAVHILSSGPRKHIYRSSTDIKERRNPKPDHGMHPYTGLGWRFIP